MPKCLGVCGGDFNCIVSKDDATRNPDSKLSPSLKRLVKTFSWQDSFRTLFPSSKTFSRYYGSETYGEGASCIDRYWSLILSNQKTSLSIWKCDFSRSCYLTGFYFKMVRRQNGRRVAIKTIKDVTSPLFTIFSLKPVIFQTNNYKTLATWYKTKGYTKNCLLISFLK